MAKPSRRRGASRAGSGTPPLIWFLSGFLLGLGAAALLLFKGVLPQGRDDKGPAPSGPPAEVQVPEDAGKALIENKGSRFDFFTVLPEMEVVVPEQELAEKAAPGPTPSIEGDGAYLLQAGSFRNMSDADQLKAKLALLGQQAEIQVVTVNGVTWHRVRLGPVQGARAADELRRTLQSNGIETLVLKDST